MKRIKVKAVNGMTLNVPKKAVKGIGTKLQDGKYLAVEVNGGFVFPIHQDSQQQFLNQIIPEG